MPKGVIDFHYDSGKQYVKKRKRLPGANPDKKPEIKQFNPYDGSATFDSLNFYPLLKLNMQAASGLVPWRLEPLVWPSVGNTANTRIGNSFFLRTIRFKGYVEISRNVLRPIRWRIKIFRFEKPFPDFHLTGDYSEQTGAYLDLYKNAQRYNLGIANARVIENSRHNFYKMVKSLPKDRPYSSKVIASGVIPVNNKLISKGTFEYGQSNSFHVGTEVEHNIFDVGCYPVDVLINCNDRITWSLNDGSSVYEPDIRYCLVLEDDFGVGVLVESAGYTPGETPVTTIPSVTLQAQDYPCYEIKLFSRAYFTDE